jgi:hypothetical protein
MLFDSFKKNPFVPQANCENTGESNHQTSIIPGREIAAAAAVSNVILEGGIYIFFYINP